jgi:hypothetical protein
VDGKDLMQSHSEIWNYWKRQYPKLPEEGLHIPTWVKKSCKMNKFELSVRQMQYEAQRVLHNGGTSKTLR